MALSLHKKLGFFFLTSDVLEVVRHACLGVLGFNCMRLLFLVTWLLLLWCHRTAAYGFCFGGKPVWIQVRLLHNTLMAFHHVWWGRSSKQSVLPSPHLRLSICSLASYSHAYMLSCFLDLCLFTCLLDSGHASCFGIYVVMAGPSALV